MKVKKIAFDPDARRKQRTQAKLDAVAHRRRRENLRVTVLGETGRCLPIPVRGCPYCGKPAPMIAEGARFVCRQCVVIFF